MKMFSLIISAVLLAACASQPIRVEPEIRTVIQPVIVPADPFDIAISNVKNNTNLFRKFIMNSSYDMPESGYRNLDDIRVVGEALIEKKLFRVTYDLAGAVHGDNNTFRIPFLLENLTDDINHNDELAWIPSDDKTGLLLSFDDNYFEAWLQYLDIFDKYNAKVTFFVQGDLNADNDDVAHPEGAALMEIFCRRALSRGHDLGYHTINHPDLRNVSENVFNFETFEAARTFFDSGISFSAFGYPYGFSETWMHDALSPVFHMTRGYGSNTRYYNSQTIKSGYLVSKAIDNIMYPDNEKFEYEMRLILLLAKFSGDCIVPFTSHEFSDGQWAITPARVEYLLGTTKELKLKFYTFRDIRQIFIQQ